MSAAVLSPAVALFTMNVPRSRTAGSVLCGFGRIPFLQCDDDGRTLGDGLHKRGISTQIAAGTSVWGFRA